MTYDTKKALVYTMEENSELCDHFDLMSGLNMFYIVKFKVIVLKVIVMASKLILFIMF